MILVKCLRRSWLLFGPFNSCSQRRWKKPVVSAQTRLETRTRDLKLDKLMIHIRKLKTILNIHQLMSQRKRGPFVSVQLMSRWRNIVGLNVGMGEFLHKYPHVFELFTHPIRRSLCCKITRRMRDLIDEEEKTVKDYEPELVLKIKKLLMMSKNGTLHVHALRLIRRELGLPEDFRDSILRKYSKDFRLVHLEIVEPVDGDESFKIEEGYREKLKNWQRLPYLKPYESKEVLRVRTCGGIERFEKWAVGIIHELLSLTVEKMLEVERLAHFRKDFAIEVNVRELLLEHPGIFYICTKGTAQTVFLREAYSKGCLITPNPVYVVQRKMLGLIILGRRNTRSLECPEKIQEEQSGLVLRTNGTGIKDGDWVIPILDGYDQNVLETQTEINDSKQPFDAYEIESSQKCVH
ncbi:hypothetical protein PTKIN_Ptkin14bG0229800 [Pterospermum kingtungense]